MAVGGLPAGDQPSPGEARRGQQRGVVTGKERDAALTSALGRDITFIDVPPETFANTLQGIATLAGPGPAGGLRALPARGGSISLPGGR